MVQVGNKALWIIIPGIQRNPGDGARLSYSPLSQQCSLSEARRRRNQRQTAAQTILQPLYQAWTMDQRLPQRRDVKLGWDVWGWVIQVSMPIVVRFLVYLYILHALG